MGWAGIKGVAQRITGLNGGNRGNKWRKATERDGINGLNGEGGRRAGEDPWPRTVGSSETRSHAMALNGTRALGLPLVRNPDPGENQNIFVASRCHR